MDQMYRHLDEVVKKSWNFSGRLDGDEKHEMNALVGLAAEAGEALDVGKKKWFHTVKPEGYWREKLLSELGDIAYYWLIALHTFGFTIEEVLAYNRKKLESRHPELGVVTERFGKEAILG
jgi:NTP pyrophosphatase (non-canonical NTP hydrolase)